MEKLNEPGIYRKADGRYHVRATAKDPETGKIREKRRTLTEDATKQEAISERERLKSEIRRPKKDDAPRWHTVADYAMHWWKYRTKRVNPSTRHRDKSKLTNWILPFFGHIEIGRLSREHVKSFVHHLEESKQPNGEDYARSTKRGRWRLAKTFLMDLKAECGLDFNPVERIRPPQTGTTNNRSQQVLNREQLDEFLEAARDHKPGRYPEILTMARTGMRPSSLYGLMWPDIKYDEGYIHIRRSATRGKLADGTKSGRDIKPPLDDELARVLREHRKRQMKQGGVQLESGLVFPSTKGTPRTSSSIRKPMHQISEHLGLDFRVGPQVMRRTVNNILRAAGVSEITLRSIIGHANAQMTEHYSDVSMSEKAEATAVLR